MHSIPDYLGGQDGFTYMGIHNLGPLAETGYEKDQPCLNNQQNLDNIVKNTLAYLDENPDVPSVHISQNDNNAYCKCADCMADIEYYGAPSGSIIEMLNYVCEQLETYKDGIYKDADAKRAYMFQYVVYKEQYDKFQTEVNSYINDTKKMTAHMCGYEK